MLSGATNAVITQGAAVGTILDDDTSLIFFDGFESGDTSAWSSTVP